MFYKTIFMVAALSLSVACKADDASTKPEATEVTEPATTNGAAVPTSQPTATQTTGELHEGLFGGIVAGATKIKVNKRGEDGTPGEERTADAAWVQKFVAAVGPELPGSEAVPRCIPQYTIAFFDGENELASFGAVCSTGSESVTLVRSGSGYTADDSATAREMLEGLFEAE